MHFLLILPSVVAEFRVELPPRIAWLSAHS